MYSDGLTNCLIFYSRYILLYYCMVYNKKYNGVISVLVIVGQPLTDLPTKKLFQADVGTYNSAIVLQVGVGGINIQVFEGHIPNFKVFKYKL